MQRAQSALDCAGKRGVGRRVGGNSRPGQHVVRSLSSSSETAQKRRRPGCGRARSLSSSPPLTPKSTFTPPRDLTSSNELMLPRLGGRDPRWRSCCQRSVALPPEKPRCQRHCHGSRIRGRKGEHLRGRSGFVCVSAAAGCGTRRSRCWRAGQPGGESGSACQRLCLGSAGVLTCISCPWLGYKKCAGDGIHDTHSRYADTALL